ncbi:hypothetical protein AN191_06890 [Loktanella sp. 5RATIMAR09]|uniref:bifunctional ADP-dependent NAD(P)H-hydrate dehydratase/NAD(P)H-hydrate epimerase n=1 Tax=Loktanella sp. 5RATIMAR09 TaxID=1225655 RepID=UPI0006EB955C|nr:bifunctional ADP-dependent NAD(P)H-hydrate dehydratase/NAD(P)H-hydrate epimerase [Loktanella sp. 5RATIMAR09]KQI72727.1 hypothetical protein AN191_06890 [Loktanella sp. 5RATIMAR09]
MTELLTAAQMRAIEAAAIASGEVTGLELMERAGRGVVEAIFEEWPELAPSWGPAPKPPEYFLQNDEQGLHRAVVLCGPGNNGGDGFVVARLLREAGWHVEVFLYGDAEKLPPDARVNYERWVAMGKVLPLTGASMDACGQIPNLVVDAVLGTGLSRPIKADLADAIRHYSWTFLSGVPVVAIDMPTGLCADSGRSLGVTSLEDVASLPKTVSRTPAEELGVSLTVTFHSQKIGQYLDYATQFCGKLVCKEIGLKRRDAQRVLGSIPDPATARKRNPAAVVTGLEWDFYTPEFMQGQSILDKTATDHKYSHGHALILSGGVSKGGAARLAARGALRVGAGAVTVGCPPAALIENAAQLNAIMLRNVKDVAALTDILADDRINALCLGPGMGVSDESRDLVEAGLKSGRAMVLDADALTLIGRDAPLFAMLHDRCVLTPHAGEFARLFPDIAKRLAAPATKGPAYSKVDATRDAARRAGCTVLFKGPDTVIADPSGRGSINASVYERSAPWLATAGSGDVLAGFITGLLARGFGPMQAAESGAWLHTECALSFGPGLIAEDLPDELPKVFRALGL